MKNNVFNSLTACLLIIIIFGLSVSKVIAEDKQGGAVLSAVDRIKILADENQKSPIWTTIKLAIGIPLFISGVNYINTSKTSGYNAGLQYGFEGIFWCFLGGMIVSNGISDLFSYVLPNIYDNAYNKIQTLAPEKRESYAVDYLQHQADYAKRDRLSSFSTLYGLTGGVETSVEKQYNLYLKEHKQNNQENPQPATP